MLPNKTCSDSLNNKQLVGSPAVEVVCWRSLQWYNKRSTPSNAKRSGCATAISANLQKSEGM